VKRSIATLAAIAGLLVFAARALADDTSSSSDATATAAATVDDSSSSAPATTTDSTTDSSTTSTPTTTSSTPTTTSSVPTTTTTTVPVTTDTITDACAVDCIPETVENECTAADCIPTSAGGISPGVVGAGTSLPFTGIGDVLAPLLLGLVVVIGGVVAWRWAQLREAVAAAASRARDMPARNVVRTGYEGALRQLDIEHRAARVFTTRVA
jgi:hypothetical protein